MMAELYGLKCRGIAMASKVYIDVQPTNFYSCFIPRIQFKNHLSRRDRKGFDYETHNDGHRVSEIYCGLGQ